MCYPAPGPRCSFHANKEYVEALQKYENSHDAAEKMILGDRLQEKREVFESTPRGQNGLRREADAVTGLAREQLLLKLRKAESIRKQQLEDYARVVVRKDTTFNEVMNEKGLQLSRYEFSCGIAMLSLGKEFPDVEFHIQDEYTLTSDKGKFLVLPEKYQAKWVSVTKNDDKFIHFDKRLQETLNNSINLVELTEKHQQLTWTWFVDTLKTNGYIGFISVNRRTQDTIISTFDKIEDLYEISLKAKKRLGGTSDYRGSVKEIEELIKNTVFSSGKVVQDIRINKTILYGVPPQAKNACFLSETIYLGWHKGVQESDGYYEVRKRHQSDNYDIHVCLKATKQVVISATDSVIFKKLKN